MGFRAEVLAAILAVATFLFLPAGACLVDFEPDRYCFSCESDDDCGRGYSCREGHCSPDDESAPDPCAREARQEAPRSTR